MLYTPVDSEFDLVARCIKCTHQKVDHDTNSSRDKMKCLIGNCNCMTFVLTGNITDQIRDESQVLDYLNG